MARITHVKSARKAQGPCYRCRIEIEVGQPYRWFANRMGRTSIKKKFCTNCTIKGSDLTTSANLQALYGAVETAEDALQADSLGLGDIAQVLRDAGEEVREVGSQYEESAANMEDGFGHSTYMSEEIAEKGDSCVNFADELDSAADEVEAMDDPDAPENEFEVEDEGEEMDREEGIRAARDERRQEAVQCAIDALGNCPL